MKNRSKFAALLGAGLLTFAVAGVAFADTTLHNGGAALSTYDQDCSDFTGDLAVGEGQVGIHFILTSPASDSGNLSGHVDNTAFGPIANADKPSNTLHWYLVVDGDGSSVVNDAVADVDGGQLNVSHVCIGAPGGGGGGATDQPPTDALGTAGQSGPNDTAWLLVVGLGVLLASIVVLTPARAKSKR
jgi:hypothetical protein